MVPQGWWLYQGDRIATNANAAGNPIIIDISVPTGTVARLVNVFASSNAQAGGTHSLSIAKLDEDNVIVSLLGTVGASQYRILYLPSIGASAAASSNIANSTNLFIGPGEKISCYFGEAEAHANQTLQVGIVLLISTNVAPTWSVARSVDVANITLAASTISLANTLQKVDLPW